MAQFNGGTRVDSKNYLTIKAGPHRDIRVATLILEAKLGRKLKPDEDVHHVNGNTLDCGECGDNLIPLGHKDHGAVSNRQRMFLKEQREKDKKEWKREFGEESTKPISEDVSFDV